MSKDWFEFYPDNFEKSKNYEEEEEYYYEKYDRERNDNCDD